MTLTIFEDILLWLKPVSAICIHCDNQVAISRTQILYITISLHIFVVDIILLRLSNEIISINFVSSKDNLADMFTKGLNGERINYTSRGMGLKT